MRFDKWLKLRDVSQNRLSKLIGVAQSSLGRLANGEPPTLRTAALVRAATGGEVEWEDMLPPDFLKDVRRVHDRVRGLEKKAG